MYITQLHYLIEEFANLSVLKYKLQFLLSLSSLSVFTMPLFSGPDAFLVKASNSDFPCLCHFLTRWDWLSCCAGKNLQIILMNADRKLQVSGRFLNSYSQTSCSRLHCGSLLQILCSVGFQALPPPRVRKCRGAHWSSLFTAESLSSSDESKKLAVPEWDPTGLPSICWAMLALCCPLIA